MLVGNQDKISLFDLRTGAEKWTWKIPAGGVTARKPVKMGGNVCCAVREYDSTILYWLNAEHGTVHYRSVLERKGDVMQTNDVGNNEILAWSLKSNHPDSLACSTLRRIRFSFK